MGCIQPPCILTEEMFELAGEELEREFGDEPEMARAAPNPDGDAPGNALFGLTPGAERDDYAFTPGQWRPSRSPGVHVAAQQLRHAKHSARHLRQLNAAQSSAQASTR